MGMWRRLSCYDGCLKAVQFVQHLGGHFMTSMIVAYVHAVMLLNGIYGGKE